MKCLVSLCCKSLALNAELPSVFLFEVDTDLASIRPVPMEHPKIGDIKGVTGLAHFRGGILVVPQVPGQLVMLDSRFQVTNVWDVPELTGGHSIAVNGRKAHIVSTRSDSVVEFDPTSGGKVYWRANNGQDDTLHMNSALWHDGRLYVSAFGPKRTLWNTATSGYIMEVATGRRIISPISQPHSALRFQGQLYWCESARMAVGKESGQQLQVGRGYTRGLVVTEDEILVGLSRRRNVSVSSRRPIDPGKFKQADCTLLVYRHNRASLDKSELAREISLAAYGDEIYDILPLTPEAVAA